MAHPDPVRRATIRPLLARLTLERSSWGERVRELVWPRHSSAIAPAPEAS